ncbi:MAG TPA: tRNA (adenosine(37)-N6)-threonylcarbamoyltransferase complex dimerization subunit type 1 TsaB [Gemmatimonadales bacterium]|nr:tRNA (adenosine(37)-N6)-threonylcarbamoyltransferase complex dimerization subunit type 1 TsaB [Gemmatimonadales bacterium]
MTDGGGRWLAIDTALETASVAVGSPPLTASATWVRGARQHAAQVIDLVDRCLAADGEGRSSRDLEGIVVGDGPGSFTGLRIGWAAAKGLMQDRDLPLVAIPSLLAAAASAAAVLGAVPVAACYDALRGQVYGAVYIVHPDRVEILVAPDVYTVAQLAERTPVRPRLAVGDGAIRYASDITRWVGNAPLGLESLTPTAASLLALVHRAGAERAITDPATAEPVYGRPAEAQVKWEARHGRPLPDSPGTTR